MICSCDASGNQEDPESARNSRADDVKCRKSSGHATRGTTPSTAFSMTVFACTLGLITALCCAVRAAPEAFSRRQADSNIVIPPAILQELQDLGLTENALQDLKQREEIAAVLEMMQQYQKEWQQQQQPDEDVNRQDGGNAPAPESYPNPPIPMTLPSKFFRPQEAPTKDENKRGNHYTYACHFKICNIGRRQNYRRSPWIRR